MNLTYEIFLKNSFILKQKLYLQIKFTDVQGSRRELNVAKDCVTLWSIMLLTAISVSGT